MRRRPSGLVLAGAVVALVLLAPLAFLVVEAAGAGAGNVAHLVWRPLSGELLWNTVRLAVVVTAACGLLGTGAAYLVERTALPGRRVFAALLVVPLAIPDFVVAFAWSSLYGWVQGFLGAVLVMSLGLYPLVYLPVAASFRQADPVQEEVARGLGAGRLRVLWRVTLGQAKVALLGGCLLVLLLVLAEYGAVEILGYQTFTTEIFTEYGISFNVPAASALSLVLVVLSLVVLAGEQAARGRAPTQRSGPGSRRSVTRHRLGRATLPALLAVVLLVVLALGVPVGACLYWMAQPGQAGGLAGVSLLDATWHTAFYGACAGLLATAMALPVAVLSLRRPGRLVQVLERSTYLVLAVPGVVVGLALGYFSEHYAGGFAYQSAPLLVLAYAVLFFPLALVGVRASVAQAPVGLEEAARSLGKGRLAVLARVTVPLVAPGLGAAFCLVFLSVVTELTATLMLVPTGVQTLATQFWAYQQNLSYAQAAPFALVIMGLAAVPSYLLGRFFDRLPARQRAAGAATADATAEAVADWAAA